MLDINEIKELEKRYESYVGQKEAPKNQKTKSKFWFWFLCFDIVATIIICIVLAIDASVEKPTASQQIAQSNISPQQSQTSAIINEAKEKSQQAKAKFDDNVKQEELADKIAQKIEQSLKSNDTNEVGSARTRSSSRDSQQGWLKLNLKEDELKVASQPPKEEAIDFEPMATAQEKAQPTQPKKAKIDIQVSASGDELSALKDEFIKTNNPSYALEVAKLSFAKADYQEALKWSLSANEIDNSLEDTWVIFAKSKYKLKQKDDALRALREYNKSAKKPAIDTLIKQIEDNSL